MINDEVRNGFFKAFEKLLADQIETGLWLTIVMQAKVSFANDCVTVDYVPDHGSDRNPHDEVMQIIKNTAGYDAVAEAANYDVEALITVMVRSGFWENYIASLKNYCEQTNYVVERLVNNVLQFSYKHVPLVVETSATEKLTDDEVAVLLDAPRAQFIDYKMNVNFMDYELDEFADINFIAGIISLM